MKLLFVTDVPPNLIRKRFPWAKKVSPVLGGYVVCDTSPMEIKAYGIKTLEALGQKLLGGGLQGAGLRYLVLNNPTFKAIWSDPEKRQAAAANIIGSLGDAGEALVRLFAEEMAKGEAE